MSNQSKEIAISATLAIVLVVSLALTSNYLYSITSGPPDLETGATQPLRKFSSYQELTDFLERSTQHYMYFAETFSLPRTTSAPPPSPGATFDQAAESDRSYSETNIQVEGVDEADIIKTDGEYIYLVSANRVFIIDAYPAEESEIISEITFRGAISGIFVNDDRLVVFEGGSYWIEPVRNGEGAWSGPVSGVLVYDLEDRQSPRLVRNLTLDGNYMNSRMIGDYVYTVVQQWVGYQEDGDITLPSVRYHDEVEEIHATDIYYSNDTDSSYSFTTIAAINVQDDTEAPTIETFLIGGSSSMYVSLDNIYLAVPRWKGWEPEGPLGEPSEPLQTTSIYRFSIDGGTIQNEAEGEVPGTVLNQFSMDQYDSHFRIATTAGHVARTPEEASSTNNVYVLNMALEIVGELENLAPGETIYSARFLGERGYLVTFKKVDPLFVIELSDPSLPKVLGWLKITGYSDYLHPYDENHVIGIGKEAVPAEEGDFAWYQGVKISIFDVTDVSSPVEEANYVIGDRGTESPVLHDHKALLFDKGRDLLVLPLLVAEIDPAQYPNGYPPNTYGEPVWQGAYVFRITLEDGLEVRGRISHSEGADPERMWYWGPHTVKRTLYIENVLYTVSDSMVKMTSLDDLSEINTVLLPPSEGS